MLSAQLIAYFCIVTGLSMVAGWWVAFRNRPYLGLLGASFLVLAAYLMARQHALTAQAAGQADPVMRWVQVAALAVYVVLVIAAVRAALQESRRRMAEVREHFRAAEEGLMAMMEAERRRREAQQAKADDESAEDGPGKGNE